MAFRSPAMQQVSRSHRPHADVQGHHHHARLSDCTRRPQRTQWCWRRRDDGRRSDPIAATVQCRNHSEQKVAASASTPVVSAEKPPVALSRTPRFEPWLRELEQQLLDLGVEIVHKTTGDHVESDFEDDSLEDEVARLERERLEERKRERELGTSSYENMRLEHLRRLGGALNGLAKLISEELLPKMPSDPDALFLAASCDFIARKHDTSLRLMQASLMATHDGHCTPKQLAARHYFQAVIAMRIVNESSAELYSTSEAAPTSYDKIPPERFSDLCNLIERALTEALRLDPKGMTSAYIDAEMLAQYRHPLDAHARVGLHASLVEVACATGRGYLVDKMQRPMHFYPKLRSAPWWDPCDIPWALTLMAHFEEIRDEMMNTRVQPTSSPSPSSSSSSSSSREQQRWDSVGSKHDAGDRDLVENGAWTELVLLNCDEKIASSVARNRRLCPTTLKLLDAIPAAADMARRGAGESTFSALGGGAHLKPHCGSTNCRLTCHLPLLVPPGCSIRVGNEERPYREGECMIFDDSFEHEVWHRGDPGATRVVLLVRFWHPDIPPNRYAEADHHMRKMFRQHKRRLSLPPLRRSASKLKLLS